MAVAFDSREGSEWLVDLPSRGQLVRVEPGFVRLTAPAPYVCDHSTNPPENQVISMNPSSMLLQEVLNNLRCPAAEILNALDKEQEKRNKRNYSSIIHRSLLEGSARKRPKIRENEENLGAGETLQYRVPAAAWRQEPGEACLLML